MASRLGSPPGGRVGRALVAAVASAWLLLCLLMMVAPPLHDAINAVPGTRISRAFPIALGLPAALALLAVVSTLVDLRPAAWAAAGTLAFVTLVAWNAYAAFVPLGVALLLAVSWWEKGSAPRWAAVD